MRGDAGAPVRLRFSKAGKVRFISHRDLARAFERAFRIEALPLAFTEGFAPRPRVSFGLALPVGYESEAEYLDVELTTPVDVGTLAGRLTGALPDGVTVTGAAALAHRVPALQESVTSVGYRVTVRGAEQAAVTAAAARAMASPSLDAVLTRKGRAIVEDIRPALVGMSVVDGDRGAVAVVLDLSTRPRGVRPTEVLAALDLEADRVLRTYQWIERDGARYEPLEADAMTEGCHDVRRDHVGDVSRLRTYDFRRAR